MGNFRQKQPPMHPRPSTPPAGTDGPTPIDCSSALRRPLEISQDPDRGTVTIEGTTFSRELLLDLGQNERALGYCLRIVKKADGVVVLERLPKCPECGAALDRRPA